MRIEIAQILGQIIAFLIMYWVLKRFAWKPFLSILEDRKAKIKDSFDTIDAKTKEVDELSKEYRDKLKEIDTLAAAKVKAAIEAGEKKASIIQQEALEQSKNMIAKAQDDMKKEVAKAKDQLKDEIVNLTTAAAGKLLQTQINGQKQEGIVSDLIDDMERK